MVNEDHTLLTKLVSNIVKKDGKKGPSCYAGTCGPTASMATASSREKPKRADECRKRGDEESHGTAASGEQL